jgi:Na+/proline symporter
MYWADIAAISIYLLALVAIGFWVSRRVKSMEQFVMPRRFGKVLMITFSFGTGTHADEAVGVTSKTFTNGASGIWYQWLYLFCTPFYWLIAPVMKRFRAITTADIFEARYDRSIASLYTLIGMFTLLVDMGVMLKAFGSIVQSSTGFPERTAIGLVTLVFVVYSVAGGLEAGIITDFIDRKSVV